MKRATFVAAGFLFLAVQFAGLAVLQATANGATGYGYVAACAMNAIIAALAYHYPENFARGDEPAPRRWFELAGLLAVLLALALVATLLLFG
jgi:hypothetical protein